MGIRRGAVEDMAIGLSGYHRRRVLVTGHTGFKGSWLSLWLSQLGARVTGYALAPETSPALFAEAGVASDVASIVGDVRDAEQLAGAIADSQPEIIFHLAAQSLVRQSYADPLNTLATNVMGTANLLQAARGAQSVRAVVVVTSDKCYRENGSLWGYRESDPLGGHDPYSASKAAAEIVTSAWRDSYRAEDGAPLIASARAGNVIGGGDWAADRLVPDLCRAAQLGHSAQIRNPAAVRPWQHVLEPLGGYLTLGSYLLDGYEAAAEAWNFGPAFEDMRKVGDVCQRLAPMLGARWQHDGSDQPREAPLLRLDSSNAMLRLSWAPRFDLERTLEMTGDWYVRHSNGEGARALCLEQIAIYEGMGGGA